jgi:hypothetical protein
MAPLRANTERSGDVARGWESKAIESQIEDRASAPTVPRERWSAEAQEREHRKAAHELSRKRVLEELAACRSDALRASLESALAFLNEQLARLGHF